MLRGLQASVSAVQRTQQTQQQHGATPGEGLLVVLFLGLMVHVAVYRVMNRLHYVLWQLCLRHGGCLRGGAAQ